MIFGTGIDIIEIDRIKKQLEKDRGFNKRIFTVKEINYCEKRSDKYEEYAVRFSAKEAFLKAIGTGYRYGIAFDQIEILNEDSGKPYFIFHKKAKEILKKHGIVNSLITLTHIKKFAAAFVVLEQGD